MGKISKTTRLLKVVEIFERGHVLDKKEIDTRMAASLGENYSGLGQALYRDLTELVSQGVLVQKNFRSDGSEISPDEMDSEPYSVSKWSLLRIEHQVVGKGALIQNGGNLFASKRIAADVSIRQTTECSDRDLNILLALDQGYRLALPLNALPCKLILCRNSDELDSEIFAELEEKFGNRLILLALADPTISSAKSAAKPGHLICEFSSSDEKIVVRLADLGQRNRNLVSETLSRSDLQKVVEQNLGVSGQSRTIEQQQISLPQFETIEASGTSRLLPVLVKIADQRLLALS